MMIDAHATSFRDQVVYQRWTDMQAHGECPFDQHRKKVLVTQERMAANHVMRYLGTDKRWLAEIRSYVERSNRSVIANYVKLKPAANFPASGDVFYASLEESFYILS